MQLIDDPRAQSLSNSARRLLRRPRPRYRGLLHRWAAVASVALGVVLVAGASSGRAAFGLGVFAFGTTVMLGTSALVHLRDWPIERVELMVRLDHTAIFLMLAASTTPIAMLALDAPQSGWMLALAWVGASLGIGFEWLPIHPPNGMINAIYLVLGWSMLAFIPWLITALDGQELFFLLAGGAAYTVGALIVGSRWPDPWTDTFGYHEIWHVFVVVAVGFHVALMISLGW